MNKLTIAIDFDKTWTADPALWSGFAEVASTRGHEVIIVTRRQSISDEERSRSLVSKRLSEEMLYCDYRFKRQAVELAGYNVDIWIDAEPGTIEPQRIPNPCPDNQL